MKSKKNNTKAPRRCAKFGMAITNYVLGEKIDVSRKELFNHLRKCAKCRDEFFSWQDTYAALRAEAHDAKPEVKKRFQDLLEQIGKEQLKWAPKPKPTKGEKMLDSEEEIGRAAGMVWFHLTQGGRMKINDLSRKTKLPATTLNWAIGWLARENKVCLTKKKQTAYVYLAPLEWKKRPVGAPVYKGP